MEKEQKKLLLVAVSVGVFLLVTITAAIAVMTPKINAVGEPAIASQQPIPSGSVPVVNGVVPLQQVEISERNVNASNVNNTDVESVNENINESANAAAEKTSGDIVTEDSLIINIPRPKTAAVPDAPAAPATRSVSAAAPAPAKAKPSSTSQTAQRSAARPATTANRRTAQTAAKPAPEKSIKDYWIQVGAYSSIVRAEDAKELLSDKGLVSIIENRDINGQSLYRVRLGPYTSQDEAGFWLTLVNSIDSFGKSGNPPYVSQTTRQ